MALSGCAYVCLPSIWHVLLAQVAVDILQSAIELGSSSVSLALWDTAGQERFAALSAPYYRQADGVVLVFDLGSRASFERLATYWKGEVDAKASADACVLLVAAKADLPPGERQVRFEEAQALADAHGWLYFETSAKSGVHVRDAFYLLACHLMNRALESDPKNVLNDPSIALTDERNEKGGGCCLAGGKGKG